MIDLNLIPDNLRKKKRSLHSSQQTWSIPLEKIVGIFFLIVLGIVVIHVSLVSVNLTKISQKKILEQQWEQLSEDKQKVDQILHQLRQAQSSQKSLAEITIAKRVLVAPKLNAISDCLPRGIWLNRVMLDSSLLLIEGSNVSKMADDTTNVTNFLSQLKKQEYFMNHVKNVELGPIQRKNLQGMEVADFSLTARW